MPYRNAHWWVLLVVAVIIVGFWPSYWSSFGTSQWQFHLHGVIASVWVLMVFTQSWTAHHKQLTLHRAVGRASLFLFPFLIGGLLGIIDVTAKRFVTEGGAEPVSHALQPAFMAALLVALAAYVALFYLALRHRRKVWLHAGYLLGTPLILFESPFSRVLTNARLPGFRIDSPEEIVPVVIDAILASDAIVVAFCLLVYWRVGKKAAPFLVTAGFVALQMVATWGLRDDATLAGLLRLIGHMPTAGVILAGFALGAATSWLGWQAGKRPVRTPTMPAAGSAAA